MSAISEFEAVKALRGEMNRSDICHHLDISLSKFEFYRRLSAMPQDLINLWYAQKHYGRNDPFWICNFTITILYEAMLQDHNQGIVDFDGGPKYKERYEKLSNL